MKIHVVVAISSPMFNDLVTEEVRSFLPDTVAVEVASLPSGPASIESAYDEVLAGPPILEAVQRAAAGGADCIFIDCFGDPAVPAAREIVDIPVMGGFEPAVAMALMLGRRFSVLTVLDNVRPLISGLTERMGVQQRLASIEVIDTPVLELHDAAAMTEELFKAARRAVDGGADVLVLGCTAMLGVARAVQDRLAQEGPAVPVVDPTGAALNVLMGCHTMGLRPSRTTYMPPPDKQRL